MILPTHGGYNMIRRVESLRNIMKENSLDAALISNNANKRYLSGFTGTAGYIVITEKDTLFITDFRYIEQARKQCIGYEIVEHNKEKTLYDIINSLNIKKIAFEEDFITYAQYKELENKIKNISLLPLEGAINNLRKYKDESEIKEIETAAKITDEAFDYICEFIKPNITEKEIALELEMYMRKKGATATSFEIIVASGLRSALPHGVASDKKVNISEFITMDFGCIYNGYCSDMTRTIILGKASDKQKEIYNTVLDAQTNAFGFIKPGVTGIKADKGARDLIVQRGYGDFFGHGLGHGVGLEVHEAPRLSPLSKDTLEVGMVVTNEPGIYLPDFGGVRIEDLIVVTAEGNRILSKSSKQLIEL